MNSDEARLKILGTLPSCFKNDYRKGFDLLKEVADRLLLSEGYKYEELINEGRIIRRWTLEGRDTIEMAYAIDKNKFSGKLTSSAYVR